MPYLVTFIGGLVSGLIGPLVLAWRKDKSEEKNKRREKYEQFVTTLYENDHWIKTISRIKIEKSGETELPPPHAKLEALLHVYFPDLDETISHLIRAVDRYLAMIHIKEVQMRSTTRPLSAQDQEDLNNSEREYSRSLVECLDILRQYAKKEFPINKTNESSKGTNRISNY